MELPHTYPASDVLNYFSVNEARGLSLEALSLAQEKYGPNGRQLIYKFASIEQVLPSQGCDLCKHVMM